jgi:exopolyphosphatase/guanosine-5'-triphosphate,3'-diphosphate pyrophosphatase
VSGLPKKTVKPPTPPFARDLPPSARAPRREVVQAVAAIDVGSNAMRLIIANVNRAGEVHPVLSLREPVRLGKDAFTIGYLTEETAERAIEAFHRFKAKIDEHGARDVRAVATSALREARNKDVFVDRVSHETGLDLQVIGGEEEARLVTLAVARALDLRGRLAMLIDIGGGSVEVTLLKDGDIFATESFRMGTVRLIERFRREGTSQEVFHRQVREYIDVSHVWLEDKLGGAKVDLVVGTGGNCEALADLAMTLGSAPTTVSRDHLDQLCEYLLGATYEERMQRFGLRPDRADVIVPAALVLQQLLGQARVERLHVPRVGLKDGLLADTVPELLAQKRDMHRDQVIASAIQLGRRYHFDELHGRTVAHLAVELFDRTQKQHHMGEEARLLLEVAGWLHDLGMYVNISGHHKHSQYLVSASPIVGLSEMQRNLIANVARYHRKSPPTVRHEPYRLLQPRERLLVTKLAAILRLADGLDAEHAGKVQDIRVEFKRPRMHLRIRGEGDLLLEKWAVGRKSPLFEEVFGVKVTVD